VTQLICQSVSTAPPKCGSVECAEKIKRPVFFSEADHCV
jgi:hypothetical protein